MVPPGDVWVEGVVWWPYTGLAPGSTAQHSQNEGTCRLERVSDHVLEKLKMASINRVTFEFLELNR